jgi:glycolate oxidase FAD binding subunit
MQTTVSTRPGTESDAIDGVIPRYVTEPESPEAMAETLAHASRERMRTVIRGGGTKLDWGRPPQAVDLVVSTARLNRLVAHRHGDLTATVQAGMTLRDLNRALSGERQWLPLESAFDDATVGGLVATNDSGPARHRNGTPRDLVIGITLALTDGRLIKAGGTVVKNVAGYDLGKLVSGSHGTLAGIVDVTFKLVPIPAASATLMALYSEPDADTMTREVAAIAASQVEPAAFDVTVKEGAAPYVLLLRVATSPAATDAQIAAVRGMVSGEVMIARSNEPFPDVPGFFPPAATKRAIGDPESALWKSHAAAPWRGDATVRFSWLPAKLPDVVALIGEIQHLDEVGATLVARALGAGLLRLSAESRGLIAAINRLRSSPAVGNVVVLRAPRDVKEALDVWGPPRDSDRVMRSLKQMFDPAGILNANRGPV